MRSTYLNNNQNMAYPFFGDAELPFSMSCIVGLGLCIEEEDNSRVENSFFVSDVVITENAVWLSICREYGSSSSVLGLMYANTDGYYTYIPSWLVDAVFENETILPLELRHVYHTWADAYDEETAIALGSDMQVFYSYVRNGSGIVAERRRGCGYMILGDIPWNSVGVYRGKFYLDPSCVTQMPTSVYGRYNEVRAEYMKQYSSQLITITVSGLLTFSIDGSTVSLVNEDPTNDGYISLPEDRQQRVVTINGYTFTPHTAPGVVYPKLVIENAASNYVTVNADADTIPGAVVVTISGTTEFPNCY